MLDGRTRKVTLLLPPRNERLDGYYTSDVTRMWPINGKYSPVHRELLQFVLEYRNTVLKLIRPGITTKDIYEQARVAMEPVLQRTKFSKPVYE